MNTDTRVIFDPISAEVRVDVMIVDPELAEEMLKHNTSNRPMRNTKVNLWSRAMKRGAWRVVGVIVFDIHGNLIDGQHRLLAVVRSGETVTMLIGRGFAPEVQAVIDTGAKRSAADALHLMGIVENGDPKLVAGTAKIAMHWEAGDLRQVRHFTNFLPEFLIDEVCDYVVANEDIQDSCRFAKKIIRETKLFNSASAVAFAHFVLSRIDSRDANLYFQNIADIVSEGKGSPVYFVRRCYESAAANHTPLRVTGHLAILFTGWNLRRTNKTRKTGLRLDPKYDEFGSVMSYPIVPEPLR